MKNSCSHAVFKIYCPFSEQEDVYFQNKLVLVSFADIMIFSLLAAIHSFNETVHITEKIAVIYFCQCTFFQDISEHQSSQLYFHSSIDYI